MKKILFIIFFILSTNITFSQRIYTGCDYTIYNYGDKKTTSQKIVKIKWDNDDASTIDNINYVEYPDGYIIPITSMIYAGDDDYGHPYWKFTAQDERKSDVTCYIVKYNKRDICIMIFYSKNLYYSFQVNLFNSSQ